MKNYSIILVFILLTGCATKFIAIPGEPIVVKSVEYMTVPSVEYVYDSIANDSLKEENHLLRVEVDALKDKIKKLKILYEMESEIKKINIQ